MECVLIQENIARHQQKEKNKDAVWCNKTSGSEKNCTWHVRSIPASKNNVKEAKTSYTSEFLCSSIVGPPQHATIIAKADSGVSNNYWRTEDILVLTDLKDTRDGSTVQLPNNETMNKKKTGSMPLSGSLITHAKRAHIFDRLQSALIISLGQLCDDDCIFILEKNDISILKTRQLF